MQRLGARHASLGGHVIHETGGAGRVIKDARRRDEPAAAILAIHQAFGFQLLQRLAQGDTRAVEALGELAFGRQLEDQRTLGNLQGKLVADAQVVSGLLGRHGGLSASDCGIITARAARNLSVTSVG
ncbi:hypothetical protein FQZ97_958080 [compost metagenome]